jgi:hypothetical protein
MLKRNWALIAFVYLALAEVLSLAPVPDLALCLIQPEHSEQATDHNEPKYCPGFHTGIEVFFAATNDIFERYEKLIIGGFTVVLAVSTIGLWLATKRLWIAGEKQFLHGRAAAARQSRDMQSSIAAAASAAHAAQISADALTQSERAHVFIKIDAQDFMEATTSADLAKVTVDGFVSTPVTVEFRFKNYGKTPAILREVSRDIKVSANFPDEIEYLPVEFVPTERILAADAETDPPWKCIRTHLSKVELMEIIRAQKSFWFFGRMLYDDVFGISHEHRFIYRYNSSRGWRSFDHETYSKNT